ncbi:hypothetical protein [Peristeroidobacter soli]|jgi:hypothetical protein|uniref:hypothetical protein n=1 Tax=Peristeroidobacter soli TaxID=2497877 RepID=UPI00101D85BE|nr:hypothetical protein [Peristeroidobacter soli]
MSFQIRPKLRSKLPQLLAALIVGTASTAALADELTTPPAPASQANVPARGTSMEKVEAQFGAPTERLPAVGQPPITRWKYPGFEVYFEHQLVIHTVVSG